MAQTGSNREFAELLTQLESDIKLANSNQDLLDSIDMVAAYPGPLKFNNSLLYLTSAIFSAAAAFSYFQLNDLFYSGVAAIGAIAVFVYAFKRNRRLRKLGEQAFFKSILIDNHLSPLIVPIDDFQRLFCGFKQGNHKNLIEQAYQSTDGFVVFHYHYIEREKNHDDKHLHDTHYHRYGIVLEMNDDNYDGVIVCKTKPDDASYQTSFKPAYNKFNRKLKAYGQDQMQLARFLTPAVVEKLVEYQESLDDMLLQVAGNSLCIYGELELMHHQTTPYDYTTPDEFKKDILAHEQLENLNHVLALAKTLRREPNL